MWMKKNSRILAVVLAVLLVFQFGAVCYAADEPESTQAPDALADVQTEATQAGGAGELPDAFEEQETVQAAGSGTDIVIYHTNDMHGAVTYDAGSKCIGLDRVAAVKKETPGSILVDAGDATQGLPFASLTRGADVVDVMGAAGYDVMAAGNHEFDYGTEQFLANAARASFPILAANVYKDGRPLLESGGNNGCHILIERDGKKIGFFGLTTAETATATNPGGIAGVEFKDEIETAKREIDELTAAGADVIVAVAHIGEYTNVPCDSSKLAEAMTDAYQDKLDVIIDGHSHTLEEKTVNGVLIVQTGTALSRLGKIVLHFDGSGNVTVSGDMLSYDDMLAVTPDAEVAAKIDAVNNNQKEILAEELCQVTNTLWGGYVDGIAEPRIVETNLGDFTADAYRDAAQTFLDTAAGMDAYRNNPVIGAVNGGGIRASFANGTLTRGDLVSAFPFSNTLMMKQITPAVLYEILEVSVSSITGQDSSTGLLSGQPNGGFLQVSGIRFTYDPSAQAGRKVKEVYLEESGTPLQKDDTTTQMMLVSNNFVMNGGNDYTVLASLPLVGEIGGELETVEAYVLSQTEGGQKPLAADSTEGRIVPESGYTPGNYTITARVQNGGGSPAANLPVSYYLDGEGPVWTQTDENGVLSVTVPDGPHGLALSKTQKQVYLNNYSGAGMVENEYRPFPVLLYQEPEARPEPSPTTVPTTRPTAQPTAVPTAAPTAQEEERQKPPKTGDSSPMERYLWMSLLAGGTCAGAAVYLCRKGKQAA
ncbi:5'-nucleotidase C-terminal domain-containing protein [Christensenella tenuis]|uniref:5'-nucleotidase C-terminal domain-containing protein n=1 Tax=Christensenella tenuis TaxID=2763033 RepID=A0ABR7EF23_9FIRM|nr:5'-nucleotidase C-terminal domain-containing protein [Christensenella tenuis]MBC5647634.1 5'-nucleotidase C-terminal domain-containing protein [Christensenella tenuis]